MRAAPLLAAMACVALASACGEQDNTQKAENAVAAITGAAPSRGGNAEALLAQAQQASNRGRDAEARAGFERAVQAFQSTGDQSGVGRALLALATHTRTTGQGEASRPLYARARSAFEQAGDQAGEARVIFAVAQLEIARFNNELARAGFQEAAAIFDTHNLWREEAQALLGLADSERRLGQIVAADTVLLRAGAIFEIFNDREGLRAADQARAELGTYVDENDQERLRLAENINYADQGGNRMLEALGHLGLGRLEVLAGHPVLARRALTEARQIFAEMKLPHGEFDAWVATADLEQRLGNVAAAVEAYGSALAAFTRAQDVQSREAMTYEDRAAAPLAERGAIALAQWSCLDIDPAAAAQRIAQARSLAPAFGPAGEGALRLAEGWLAAKVAAPGAAESFAAAARTFAEAGLHGGVGQSLLAQAVLAADSEAVVLYERAVAALTTARDRLAEAEAQAGLAQALARFGNAPTEANIRYRIAGRLYADSDQVARAERALAAARALPPP